MWRECVTATDCQIYAGTATNPRPTTLENLTAYCGLFYEGSTLRPCRHAISANGRYLLAQPVPRGGGDQQLTVDVWDLDTRQRHDLTWPTAKFEPTVNGGYNRGVVFSPDGSWLFALQPTGRITAVQWATSRTIEFDVVTPLTQPVNIGVNPFGVLVVGS